MKTTCFKNTVSFLLFTLLLFKVSSMHAYAHQDDVSNNEIENCTICELAIENQQAEFIPNTAQTNIISFHYIKSADKPAFYNVVTSSSYLNFSFFGRPPPSSIQ